VGSDAPAPGGNGEEPGALSLRPLEVNILVSAGIVLAGIAVAGRFAMLPGAACGAAIVWVNFYLIRKILEKAFAGGKTIGKGFVVQYVLKFLGLVAVVWLVVKSGWFDILGFLLGLSSLFLGVLLEGLTRAVRSKSS
jgi:hypothetical protein